MFASTKQQLPVLTIVMMARPISSTWWWAILIGIAAVVYLVKATLSRDGPRLAFDRWLLTARSRQARARLQHGALREHARHPDRRACRSCARCRRRARRCRTARCAATSTTRSCACAKARRSRRAQQREDVSARARAPDPLGEATGDVTTMLDRAAEGESRELERRTMFLTSCSSRC
ncbi:hypothetical protein [Burkholderia mallei]|uniref:hypothetical protein n=1 Tax=Burkholderia mallei TaxID=13373 RepID=UPI003BEEDB47